MRARRPGRAPGYRTALTVGCLGWLLGFAVSLQSLGSCGYLWGAWMPEMAEGDGRLLVGALTVCAAAAVVGGALFWHYMRDSRATRWLFLVVVLALTGAPWLVPRMLFFDGIASYGAGGCAVSGLSIFGWYQGVVWSVAALSWIVLLAYVVFGPLERPTARSAEPSNSRDRLCSDGSIDSDPSPDVGP